MNNEANLFPELDDGVARRHSAIVKSRGLFSVQPVGKHQRKSYHNTEDDAAWLELLHAVSVELKLYRNQVSADDIADEYPPTAETPAQPLLEPVEQVALQVKFDEAYGVECRLMRIARNVRTRTRDKDEYVPTDRVYIDREKEKRAICAYKHVHPDSSGAGEAPKNSGVSMGVSL